MSNQETKPGYLRVSNIISPFSGIEFVPAEILEVAADRGTRTHQVVESFLRGEELGNIDGEVLPYFNSFKLFWEGSKHAWECENGKLIIEQRMYCDKLMITGCMDLIVQTPQRTYLFDWKTSSRESNASWRLQSAAYRYLAAKNGYCNLDELMFVHLKKEGSKPTLYKYSTFESDLMIFEKCLELYRFFKMDSTRERWR